MGLFSDFVGFVGDVISGVGSFLSEGLSMAVGALTGIAETIGNGIKSLCESVGSEALALIGCIAMSILIPGFGLPEIFAIIECIAQVAKILGVGGEDSPEELGMKTEIADKKPEDFDTIQDYIKYLNEEVKLDKDAVDNLSEVDKAKYGAMGAALNIKAIEEKIKEKLPHNPTADIFVSPSCPIIIWSTIEKDACSILCNVTGIAILHNDFINSDIIILPYFLFLLSQQVTLFPSHILLHRALPPGIQLQFLL